MSFADTLAKFIAATNKKNNKKNKGMNHLSNTHTSATPKYANLPFTHGGGVTTNPGGYVALPSGPGNSTGSFANTFAVHPLTSNAAMTVMPAYSGFTQAYRDFPILTELDELITMNEVDKKLFPFVYDLSDIDHEKCLDRIYNSFFSVEWTAYGKNKRDDPHTYSIRFISDDLPEGSNMITVSPTPLSYVMEVVVHFPVKYDLTQATLLKDNGKNSFIINMDALNNLWTQQMDMFNARESRLLMNRDNILRCCSIDIDGIEQINVEYWRTKQPSTVKGQDKDGILIKLEVANYAYPLSFEASAIKDVNSRRALHAVCEYYKCHQEELLKKLRSIISEKQKSEIATMCLADSAHTELIREIFLTPEV